MEPPPASTSAQLTLTLRDGRTLAYARGGDLSSRKVFVGLHGVFGVGDASPYMSKFLANLGWRALGPTLPGWGTSSPFPPNTPVSAYATDLAELLAHELGGPATHIIYFGGSYGSVWAYAAAANAPPAGFNRVEPASAIRGLMIMGGFSPFREHEHYTDGMSWMNYLTVGRPGLWYGLSWVHPLVGRIIQSKVKTVEGARELLRMILTGPKAMTTEERDQMTAWALSHGTTFDEWEGGMAANMSASVRDTLAGYCEVPAVLNAD